MPGATARALISIPTSTKAQRRSRDFAGPREADGYRRFCKRAESIYRTLRDTFISGSRPGPVELGDAGRTLAPSRSHAGYRRSRRCRARSKIISRDPRLRQLFGRYATYCGSSPFLAPATLMLVAHVEREGVWIVEGGMARLAEALARTRESSWRDNFAFGNESRGSSSRTAARRAWRRTRASGSRRTPSSGTGTPPRSPTEARGPKPRAPSPQPRPASDRSRPSPGR